MTSTSMKPTRRYELEVGRRIGQTVALTRPTNGDARLRLLETPPAKHPTEIVHLAWDNPSVHEEQKVEVVIRCVAACPVLLYLSTSRLWLNSIGMKGRQLRRKATHCKLLASIDALVITTRALSDRHNCKQSVVPRSSEHIPLYPRHFI